MSKDEKKTLLEFPCTFPIKVVGEARPDFEASVLAIVHRHVESLGEVSTHTRHSKGKKYMSMTVTIEATSQAQLDAIYTDLSAEEHILMTL